VGFLAFFAMLVRRFRRFLHAMSDDVPEYAPPTIEFLQKTQVGPSDRAMKCKLPREMKFVSAGYYYC